MTPKNLPRKFLFLAATFLLSACFSTCRLDNDTTYYDVEADGYVIYARTGKPVVGTMVEVRSGFKAHNWTTKDPVEEWYYADSNGYYRIRFLKKVDGEEVVYNSIGISAHDTSFRYRVRWGTDGLSASDSRSVSLERLQSSKITIRLDTAKIYPRDSIF